MQRNEYTSPSFSYGMRQKHKTVSRLKWVQERFLVVASALNGPATAIWAQPVVSKCTHLQPHHLPSLIHLANIHICLYPWAIWSCESSLAVVNVLYAPIHIQLNVVLYIFFQYFDWLKK